MLILHMQKNTAKGQITRVIPARHFDSRREKGGIVLNVEHLDGDRTEYLVGGEDGDVSPDQSWDICWASVASDGLQIEFPEEGRKVEFLKTTDANGIIQKRRA